MCQSLSPIANGSIRYTPEMTSNYTLGAVATYVCNTGFFLDLSSGGSRKRTCIDDGDDNAEGVFDHTAPTCIRKSTLTI